MVHFSFNRCRRNACDKWKEKEGKTRQKGVKETED